MPEPDAVDRVIAQWRRERPDLDLAAMATIGRLGRLAALARPLVEAGLAPHGLTTGEFDVLAALRRAGEPFTLTPTVLARTLVLSPAAMTHRLDRLEAAGAVTRELDRGNRRSVPVTLTPEGRARVDAAVTDHVATEERLLAALSRPDRDLLDDLLRRLLAGLPGPPDRPGQPG
ncbi:MarR family transcriptional regulator [Pseudonocardia petroleophila]|uniref:MarR family transcriptional regulator n=1 Tax=Pseudonocardia petroleophila TaxID=37331 RepID=A0A7G7MPR5_9PSEU|nr:MarR family transcriptional regulator [Pseudonocardia petroleophila]QNG54776.1 MarR family transcriptional regulator [Pseudonocardia petroleophila]